MVTTFILISHLGKEISRDIVHENILSKADGIVLLNDQSGWVFKNRGGVSPVFRQQVDSEGFNNSKQH